MNGYNLLSRLFGFRNQLRQHKIAAYIPDVTDISSWVNNRRTSDEITMGLASLWGSIDCIVDAVIGFLSANYTLPVFEIEERIETIRQFLHFTWVIMRLVIKSLILCRLFEYSEFLSRRDQMPKMVIVEPGQASVIVRENMYTY
ncbi:hypothetical protein MTO96_026493 [Rhipicephalus appendiculatus]